MKTTKLILIALAFIGLSSMAMATKMTRHTTITGDTSGKYHKPGAAIDIKYKTQHIQAGDESEISITFSTHIKHGNMNTSISLGKGLQATGNFQATTSFALSPTKTEYTQTFKVIADQDGIFYIRIGARIGNRARKFAIPVYVGNAKSKLKRKKVQTDSNGKKIIIYQLGK